MPDWPTSAPSSSPDAAAPGVLVLGGGPAGCAAALRLAALGHRVTLVERGTAHKAHGCESLAPSVARVLHELGAGAVLRAAGARPVSPPAVHWPGAASAPAAHRPTMAGEAGWLVAREAFDAALRAQVLAAGVPMLADHAEDPAADGARWTVRLRTRDMRLPAAAVVDARGRRASAAPTARCTLALAAQFELPGTAAAPDDAAHVETFDAGWVWAVPVAPRRWTAVFFRGAEHGAGRSAVHRHRLAAELLAGVPMLARRLAGARCLGVQAGDATPRAADDAAPSPTWLRVGDAAFTLDPLSAQGVAAALRSGLQAAACVHTALRRPEHAGLAQVFHRQQCRRVAARHAEAARAFHAGAVPAGTTATATRPWPEPGQRVRRHPQLQDLQAPALVGGFIAPQPALLAPGWDGPVAWLAGQPIHAWLPAGLAGDEGLPLAPLVQAWCERHGAERSAAALRWLWDRQALVAASGG